MHVTILTVTRCSPQAVAHVSPCPVHDRTLEEGLDAARANSELAPLVDALHALPHP
jgi:hypothetical protein